MHACRTDEQRERATQLIRQATNGAKPSAPRRDLKRELAREIQAQKAPEQKADLAEQAAPAERASKATKSAVSSGHANGSDDLYIGSKKVQRRPGDLLSRIKTQTAALYIIAGIVSAGLLLTEFTELRF